MKKAFILGARALTLPVIAHAAETAAPQNEGFCSKKGEDGTMACCKDKAEKSGEQGHEGHDMKDMKH